jgi:hypothetical protein
MSWLKTIWSLIVGKNILDQNFIPQEIITAFAKKLDDLARFDIIFKGKLAFLEKYDAWLFEQMITGLLSLIGVKVGTNVIKMFENTMVGFNTGDFQLAKASSTELLAAIVDFKKLDNNIEIIVVASQVEMVFNVLDYYLDKQIAPA